MTKNYDKKDYNRILVPQKSLFLLSLDRVADHTLETVLVPNSLRNWQLPFLLFTMKFSSGEGH
jgi:hypothetical protein